MPHDSHPAYQDAIRQAVRIAANCPISNNADARVWFNASHDTIGVSACNDRNFTNPDLETIAYVQRWNDRTVKIREQSESYTVDITTTGK